MERESWQKVKAIFDSVIQIGTNERSAFLKNACADDAELRREVESLLSSSEAAGSFMETPFVGEIAEQLTGRAANRLEPGQVLSRYKIVRKIGSGGMGEVYLAEDTKLDRKVAIKFLNQEFSKDEDKLNRFVQEAKAVSALNHPNILTVFEIGEDDGKNYIVTEFIEGKTLRENHSPKETNSLNSILKIGVQVAEALSAAHQAGIIHRDIKPENIMIRQDGYVKVLDFGLAKLTEEKQTDEISLEGATKALVKTNTGMVMGTVSYMSPEQSRGKETDARTDIWSLGVVLYEMLAGKVPFTGETINHTIVSILEKEPKLLENVPNELQRIVRKTLTKDVEMRYQTARDLLIDLKNLRRDLDIQGELERSIVPNREATTSSVKENGTQIYAAKSIEETKAESDAHATQNVTTSSSSLEYAVTQAKRHKLEAAIVGIILFAAISAIAYFGFFAKSNVKKINSIAVMPFVNDSGNADVEYLSDGMTETLISSLTQLPNLNVKARSSVFRYKGKETDAKTLGKELNVQAILNGRVAQRGEQLTLSLELVDAATENAIWSQQYTRQQTDLVSLQSEIARDVSSKLKSKLSDADVAKVEKTYTANPEAYQLYLKGNYEWNKHTQEDLQKSIEYYNQALEKDSNYALPYAGLSASYGVLADNYLPPIEAFPKAKAYAAKALALDDALAEAHASMGAIRLYYDWDWAEAEKELKRAQTLDPNSAVAYHLYGDRLEIMGRFDEAKAERKRAMELDPLSPIFNMAFGATLYFAGEYDEAIAQNEKTINLEPRFTPAYLWLGQAYEQNKMYAEAIATFQKGIEKAERHPSLVAALGHTYALAGKRDKANKALDELREMSKHRYISPYFFAVIYVGLGDKEQGFAWLEKAYQDRSGILIWLKVEPQFDDLRDDPHFTDLLRRIGLQP